MTSARSFAASVAALGFASALTAAPPAFAAPTGCERPENYAALASAEPLRIERLEVDAAQSTSSGADKDPQPPAKTGDRVLDSAATPLDPTGEDGDTLSEGIGMLGEAALDSAVPGGAAAVTDPDARRKALEDAKATGSQIADRLPEALGTTPAGEVATIQKSSGASANESAASRRAAVARQATAGDTDPTEATSTAGNADTPDDETDTSGAPDTGEDADTAGDADAAEDADADAAGDADASGEADAGDADTARRDAEKSTVLRGIGVGETRAALVASAQVSSAAAARILDGTTTGKAAWTKPIIQQAPPTNATAATRKTLAGHAGPLRIGAGQTTAHAQWSAGMACGATAGEASRAATSVHGVSLLGRSDGALVGVPEEVESATTTALDRTGGEPRTVASATVTAGQIDLAGGRVRVRVLRAPALTATMSATAGKIDYRPAQLEISGDGVGTKRLDEAGGHVDITLRAQCKVTEGDVAGLGDVRPGSVLQLPSITALPQLGASAIDHLPGVSVKNGTRLRISLGGAEQARQGHAIAAKATAIKVSVTQSEASKGRGSHGYGGKSSTAVSLDLGFGQMEAAAAAPETPDFAGASGAAGDLPITGPAIAGLAAGGLALLAAGGAAVAFGIRRRRIRS